MARLFSDESSEYLEANEAIVSAYPFTFAAWCYLDEATLSQAISVADSTATTYWSLYVAVNYSVICLEFDGAQKEAISTDTGTINTWLHGCAVFAASDDRRAYLNGGNKGTDNAVGTLDPADIDICRIGVSADSTPFGYFSGRVAEAAAWKAALTDAEVAMLGRGVRPPFVRPGSLAAYWPLLRPGDQDWWAGRFNMTPVNGPGWANHPPKVNSDGLDLPNGVFRAPEVKQFWMIPFFPGIVVGTTCWGQVTGVLETNIRTFDGNWSGTGEIQNVGGGDAERLALEAGEDMVSEVVDTDTNTVELLQNEYAVGDDVDLDYRHGATEAACLAAGWNDYAAPFVSLGFVQVRLTSTL